MKKTDLFFVIAILSSLCVIFFIIMVGQNAEINSLKNREDENVTGVFHLLSYNRFYNLDEENPIHSNYDFDEGNVTIEGNIAKMYSCYDVVKWFKYNYVLIGKPNRILIYKCKKEEL